MTGTKSTDSTELVPCPRCGEQWPNCFLCNKTGMIPAELASAYLLRGYNMQTDSVLVMRLRFMMLGG